MAETVHDAFHLHFFSSKKQYKIKVKAVHLKKISVFLPAQIFHQLKENSGLLSRY
jgi:hypothetical protein